MGFLESIFRVEGILERSKQSFLLPNLPTIHLLVVPTTESDFVKIMSHPRMIQLFRGSRTPYPSGPLSLREDQDQGSRIVRDGGWGCLTDPGVKWTDVRQKWLKGHD